MNLKDQVIQDAKALQHELERLGIDAVIDPRRCNPGGNQLAFYGLRLRGKTSAANVAKVLPELMRVISRSRCKRTHLRFDDMLLRFEAEHPAKKPLQWLPSVMRRTRPGGTTLGVSYHDGEDLVSFDFDSAPQVLVAGETGSGKTVLVRNVITSLCYSTSPADLRIVLIDPKNEDLRPYAALPHVLLFAGRPDDIVDAVNRVYGEVEKRVAHPNRKPYRLLLVIDELAQLTQYDGLVKTLGKIMGIGRTKLVNVVACTQQPTEEGGMGAMMKANVPLRLIGAVSAGQSYTATRRKNAGADMLPGNGAFLFIRGLEMFRFQSYFMDSMDERHAIAMIAQRWGSTASTTTDADSVSTRVVEASRKVVVEESSRSPIKSVILPSSVVARDEIDDIADQILDLVAEGASKNAMCKAVFGRPYAGSYAGKIDQAIERVSTVARADVSADDGKIIRLRKAG